MAADLSQWFAGSAAAALNGAPLLFFHGSNQVFSNFDVPRHDQGIYFSTDPEYAAGYASAKAMTSGGSETLYPVHLAIRNPLKVSGENREAWERYVSRGFSASELANAGYDGILVVYDDGEIEAMVLSPDQIRSALSPDRQPPPPDLRISERIGGGYSPHGLRQALQRRFGEAGIRNLERSGLLRVVASEHSLPSELAVEAIPQDSRHCVKAFLDNREKRSYLIACNITDEDEAARFLMHELGAHFYLRDVLGRKSFRRLVARVRKLAATDPLVQEQVSRVREYYPGHNPSGQRFWEEVIAHLVERPEAFELPWVKRITTAIKAFLLRLGLLTDWITPFDIAAFAASGLRSMSKSSFRRPGDQSQPAARRFLRSAREGRWLRPPPVAHRYRLDDRHEPLRRRLLSRIGAQLPRVNDGAHVDGRIVRDHVPNMSSIAASLDDYTVLYGIRNVPMSAFGGPRSVFYAADDFKRSRQLATEINASGEISPLIIVLDADGPYILEGSHRYVALHELDAASFPAVVVIDDSNPPAADLHFGQDSPAPLAAGLPQQIDTTAFKRWFGDSKVVDDHGQPLIVYHGTSANFTAFSNSQSNFCEETSVLGHFFSNSAEEASMYAQHEFTVGNAGPNIVPVYLSIKKPKYEDGQLESVICEEWTERQAREYRRRLEADGHDGIIFRRPKGRLEYVAFRPEQIKSATGNRGTFDTASPRIDMRIGSARQTAGTHSPAFRRWFGASKIVDSAGRPLKVYHGTTDAFTIFESRERYASRKLYLDGKRVEKAEGWKMGDDRTGAPQSIHYAAWSDIAQMGAAAALEYREAEWSRSLASCAQKRMDPDTARHINDLRRAQGKVVDWRMERHLTGDAFYFSPDPKYAESFSGGRGVLASGGNLMPVYLSISNPIYLDSAAIEIAGWVEKVALYKAQGYDGAIFAANLPHSGKKRPLEQIQGADSAQIVAFDPGQIKSAIGNNGDYDPHNPRIDKRVGGIHERPANRPPETGIMSTLLDQNGNPIKASGSGAEAQTALEAWTRLARDAIKSPKKTAAIAIAGLTIATGIVDLWQSMGEPDAQGPTIIINQYNQIVAAPAAADPRVRQKIIEGQSPDQLRQAMQELIEWEAKSIALTGDDTGNVVVSPVKPRYAEENNADRLIAMAVRDVCARALEGVSIRATDGPRSELMNRIADAKIASSIEEHSREAASRLAGALRHESDLSVAPRPTLDPRPPMENIWNTQLERDKGVCVTPQAKANSKFAATFGGALWGDDTTDERVCWASGPGA